MSYIWLPWQPYHDWTLSGTNFRPIFCHNFWTGNPISKFFFGHHCFEKIERGTILRFLKFLTRFRFTAKKGVENWRSARFRETHRAITFEPFGRFSNFFLQTSLFLIVNAIKNWEKFHKNYKMWNLMNILDLSRQKAPENIFFGLFWPEIFFLKSLIYFATN